MVGILLLSGDEILMIKRSEKQKIAPGLWSNIGGHMEPEELNDPQAACLRELQEETGYQADEITGLHLRYISMGEFNGELYIYYDYVAHTNVKHPLPACSEGQLAWVPVKNLHALKMPETLHQLLNHFQEHPEENHTHIGTISENLTLWTPDRGTGPSSD